MRLARPSRTQGSRMQSGANLEGKGALPGRHERTIRQFLRHRPGAGQSRVELCTLANPAAEAMRLTVPPPNWKDAEKQAEAEPAAGATFGKRGGAPPLLATRGWKP